LPGKDGIPHQELFQREAYTRRFSGKASQAVLSADGLPLDAESLAGHHKEITGILQPFETEVFDLKAV